jgi:hypothetical protein
MRKQARRTKARKVESRLSCRTVSLRNSPFRHPKNRSTRLRAFRSAFRRRNARFPPRVPFPRRGFFGRPARIPRRRNPSRIAFASSAASAYTPFGRVRARPLPLFFTRKPPSASSNRRQSCSFPGPTTTLKGSPSSFTKTCTFVPFRFLCPSIPTPSPFFRLHQRGINRHRLHLHLPQRIPPVQKGWQDLVPDPLLLEFLKPPPGGLIGAIWARHIAPPATCNPHIQDPVEDLAVIHPRSSGFGPGWQQGRKESPRFIGQPLKPHRSSPPRQAGRRQRILQPDTRFLRRVPCRIPRLRGDAGIP